MTQVPIPRAAALLRWYDAHARALPWRAPPHCPRMDPYRVWLSEIMLQQTTVAAVIPYFEAFTARWPSVDALAAAPLDDVLKAWAGLGYYARARNLHACARAVAALGAFPADEAGLRTLPGIGPYTAAAIASIAFGQRAVVVDGNVERVMTRLFAIETPLPAAKPDVRKRMDQLTPAARAGDFAQAVMDLGAGVCTPRAPACLQCPWQPACHAGLAGSASQYPRKLRKLPKPIRKGTAYWLEAQGHVLLERRPPRGLLGGMAGVPSDTWATVQPAHAPPVAAHWQQMDGIVTHTFTHFHLELQVMRAVVARQPTGAPGFWHPLADLDDAGLPTVFARVAQLVRGR